MRRYASIAAAVILAAAPARAAEAVLKAGRASGDPASPSDRAWKKAPPVAVPLMPQTFTLPHGGGAVKAVEARALTAGGSLYVRLSWEDGAKNDMLSPGGTFSDGCAVEFAVDPSTWTSPMMGLKGAPVNIWYWRAAAATPEKDRYDQAYSDFYRKGAIHEAVSFDASPAQSLFAEGFGTLSPGGVQDVTARGEYGKGRWNVVFKRALKSSGGAAFPADGSVPVAFAVWDGEDQDRDGSKSLSVWHTLVLGGGRTPAPATPEARGERVFNRHGCVTCHGPGGRGGVKNRNAQGGEVPSIYKVRDGFTEAEVEQVIRIGRRSVPDDPNGPLPPLRMNNWGQVMSEEELHDLVKFLWTLAPKSEEW